MDAIASHLSLPDSRNAIAASTGGSRMGFASDSLEHLSLFIRLLSSNLLWLAGDFRIESASLRSFIFFRVLSKRSSRNVRRACLSSTPDSAEKVQIRDLRCFKAFSAFVRSVRFMSRSIGWFMSSLNGLRCDRVVHMAVWFIVNQTASL